MTKQFPLTPWLSLVAVASLGQCLVHLSWFSEVQILPAGMPIPQVLNTYGASAVGRMAADVRRQVDAPEGPAYQRRGEDGTP